MNRTTFHFNVKLQRDHHNIAHLISKGDSLLYAAMSCRVLPEIVHISYEMEVRMTRYPPYERLFEIAFMRAVQAGALEAKLKQNQES